MFALILLVLFQSHVALSGTPLEVFLITSWANQTTNSGNAWDTTASPVDYCNWDGFSCTQVEGEDERHLSSIEYTCPSSFYGQFPPIDVWYAAALNGSAFNKTTKISFVDCLFGPNISQEVVDLIDVAFNFSITYSGPTPFFSCPLPERVPSGWTCSPTTIVTVAPPEGLPLAGGLMQVTMNKVTNWIGTKCRINGRFTTDAEVTDVQISGQNSVLSCTAPPAPTGSRNFVLDILGAEDEVLTQTSFNYGYGCPPGMELIGGTCTPCSVGTVKLTHGFSCIPTPLGLYSNTSGDSLGLRCPDGLSASNVGSDTILRCNTVCQAGRYSTVVGCSVCPAGTFSGPRASECTICPSGWRSPPESSECTPCPAGMTGLENECIPCETSNFSAVAGSGCTPCREGQTNNSGLTGCVPCPTGSYRLSAMRDCEPCPPGTASNTPGAPFCPACRQGTFTNQNGSTQCEQCPDGLVTYTNGSIYCFSPDSDAHSTSSYVAGIVLVIIGGILFILAILSLCCFFAFYYPRKKKELKGIERQMDGLAKSST